jgi:hypothetical protein
VPRLCVLALLGLGACSSFGTASPAPANDGGADATASDAGVCAEETCTSSVSFCNAYDFTATSCPAEWGPGGDPDAADVFRRCDDGALHIVAKDTLDATMTLEEKAPDTAWAARIWFRLTAHEVDDHPIATIVLEGNVIAVLNAASSPGGHRFTFCQGFKGPCVTDTIDLPPGEEHLWTLDVNRFAVDASVDCKHFASLTPPATLPPKSNLDVVFGHQDGDPFDADYDDVVVKFRDSP